MPIISVKLGDSLVQKYFFDKEIFAIGRAKDNDIIIETLSVSRNHAQIHREGDHFVLTDLQSANGTFVNGVRISKTEIMDDDVIAIGKHRLHFSTKSVDEEQVVEEAFDAERTMRVPARAVGILIVTRGKQKDQEFTLDRYETLIGRGEDCHVRLYDWFVGKRHAVIYREGREFVIRDLGKWGGLAVNGQRVHDRQRLHDGDEVKAGPVSLSFRVRSAEPPEEPAGREPMEMPPPQPDRGMEPQELLEPMQLASVEAELEPAASGTGPFAGLVAAEAAEAAAPDAGVQGAADAAPLGFHQVPLAPWEEEAEGQIADVEPRGQTDEGQIPTEEEPVLRTADVTEQDEPACVASADETDGAPKPAPVQASLAGDSSGEARDSDISMDQPVAITESLAAEAALFEGDIPLAEPALELADVSPEEGALGQPEPSPAPDEPAPPAVSRPEADRSAEAAEADPAEIALWEKALRNPSPIIRREAAKTLKKLTGREYDV